MVAIKQSVNPKPSSRQRAEFSHQVMDGMTAKNKKQKTRCYTTPCPNRKIRG